MRTVDGVGRLRTRGRYRIVRRAIGALGVVDGFRVVHVSIQSNHIHTLIEARDERVLASGVQRLSIAIAKGINKTLARKGQVFAYRYHRVDIATPRQMRGALAYVLNNWRRHREDITTPGAENVLVDPYSTACSFDGWADLDEVPPWERLPVREPTTWLLRVGWRRHGLVGVREVPGPRPGPRG